MLHFSIDQSLYTKIVLLSLPPLEYAGFTTSSSVNINLFFSLRSCMPDAGLNNSPILVLHVPTAPVLLRVLTHTVVYIELGSGYIGEIGSGVCSKSVYAGDNDDASGCCSNGAPSTPSHCLRLNWLSLSSGWKNIRSLNEIIYEFFFTAPTFLCVLFYVLQLGILCFSDLFVQFLFPIFWFSFKNLTFFHKFCSSFNS